MDTGAVMLDTWIRQPTNDIYDRLAELGGFGFTGLEPSHSRLPFARSGGPRSVDSTTFSMARTLVHQSNTSNGTPSLYSSTLHTDTSTLEDSISTGLANHLSGFPPLQDVNGALEQPALEVWKPTYECLFWFLNCAYLSHDKDEWEVHCLSHFCGEDPPRSVSCPLCDWEASFDDGLAAWNTKMQHLADDHFQYGRNLSTSRPDFHLFTHLWQKRLIDNQDLKELKGGNHNLMHPPTNFVTTDGPRSRRARAPVRHRMQHIGSAPARRR
ncbi:hypothetical protein E8E11_006003 [Didymella keratinophila]|nr:hypothetical protein E8E11_006003 [Didymella keratinophila]